jgi:hypothetical protein
MSLSGSTHKLSYLQTVYYGIADSEKPKESSAFGGSPSAGLGNSAISPRGGFLSSRDLQLVVRQASLLSKT